MGLFAMLTSCSSQKKIVANVPFTIGDAYCQEWTGGKAESGKGMLVKIPVSEMEGYTLEGVYFRGQMGLVTMEEENGQKFAVVNLHKNNTVPKDIIMHKDPKQEVGNKPTTKKKTEDFPFELQKDEAVLSYSKNGRTKYCKVKGIKDKAALVYPSKPQQ